MTKVEIKNMEDQIFGRKSLEEIARMAAREVELFPNNPLCKEFIEQFKTDKAKYAIDYLANIQEKPLIHDSNSL